jgi:hypothetical protein
MADTSTKKGVRTRSFRAFLEDGFPIPPNLVVRTAMRSEIESELRQEIPDRFIVGSKGRASQTLFAAGLGGARSC